MTGSSAQINFKALTIVVATSLLGVGLIALLNRGEGPASRCEDRGGYYMVGPAGETSCLSRKTFLPMAEPPGR